MPATIYAIGVQVIAWATGTTVALAPYLATTAGIYAIGGAVVLAGVSALSYGLRQITAMDVAYESGDGSRAVTVRSTVAPQAIVYGEALVSGPISYVNVAGTQNRDLYQAIVLAAHEVSDITSVYFDDVEITDAQIGGGSSSGGNVAAPSVFGPDSAATTIARINKHLGTSTQAADADLEEAFDEYTSAHQLRGLAYVVLKLTLTNESQETWDKYGAPQNIRCIVKGKKCYDARLEVAAGGTAGASPTNGTYIAYTSCPPVCVVDYLMDTSYGMSIPSAKIDWASVITASDYCDISVDIPDSETETRFTANGVLYATENHRKNIDRLLSSCNGTLLYAAGKFYLHVGYTAPSVSLDEDNLIGAIGLKTAFERNDRFNTVGAVYIDPASNYKLTEMARMSIPAAVTRDNGETLDREITLPFTHSSYMAQRIAYKLVLQSDLQQVLTFPCNLKGLDVKPGDRVNVSIDELSWTDKIFRCIAWSFSDAGDQVGTLLTLREDSSGAYADPATSAYSTITQDGVIVPGFPGVPPPEADSLQATAVIDGIELDFNISPNLEQFNAIAVYAAANGDADNWDDAVEIGRGMFTSFVHNQSTAADAIDPGDQRWYWIRALRYGTGTGDGAVSIRDPDTDTSDVTATAGSPGTGVTTVVDEATDDGTATCTVTRTSGGTTTISVNWQISGGGEAATTPFPSTIVVSRDASAIRTFEGIVGEYDFINPIGAADGTFSATFVDTDSGTGSTAYTMISSNSVPYTETFQLIVAVS